MEVLCGIFLTGLNPSIIGGFSGLCASMGVAATFLSAYLVRRLGILKVASYICLSPYQITRISGSGCNSYRYVLQIRFSSYYQAGAAGLIFQASLLAMAVAVYWSGSLSQQNPLLFFLCLIVSMPFYLLSYRWQLLTGLKKIFIFNILFASQ